jgi:hypothetical protein
MRLSILAALAPLVSLAAADSMVVYVFCTTSSCNYMDGRWQSAFGEHFIDARGGCHDPPNVPGMNNICIDWAHNRAHFFFDGQGKRCLQHQEWNADNGCAGYESQCSSYTSIWREVACTW